MEEHFNTIKEVYKQFYNFLFAKHQMFPVKDTEKGYWGVSVADELYELFKKINLHEYEHFVDLGSGDGKAVMIASLFTKAKGVECDPWLVDVSNDIKNKLYHVPHVRKTDFENKDYMLHELNEHDIVFMNPDKKDRDIQNKLLKEFNGTLVSYGPYNHMEKLNLSSSFHIEGTPVSIYDLSRE